MNGLLPHHIAAIERAILMNEQQASALAENGDYSAEMPAGDAEALREVLSEIAALKAECERLRQQCQEEIRLRDEAARRAVTAETREREALAEIERLRRDAELLRVKRTLCPYCTPLDAANAEGER